MDQLLMTRRRIICKTNVERDTLTDVVTVCTSGQQKPAIFWLKSSEQFKIRCANQNGTHSMLVKKMYF